MRYLITAAIAFTLGVLVGIGVAEYGRHEHFDRLETDANDLRIELQDARDTAAGAKAAAEVQETQVRATRRELVAARAELAKLKPPSKAEIEAATVPLAQLAATADEEMSDDDWERLKKANLDAPPKVWSTTATDSEKQLEEFRHWCSNTPFLSPDAEQAVVDWLEQDKSTKLEIVVTNKPTGAQYQVRGEKRADGAKCSIKFVGNLNW